MFNSYIIGVQYVHYWCLYPLRDFLHILTEHGDESWSGLFDFQEVWMIEVERNFRPENLQENVFLLKYVIGYLCFRYASQYSIKLNAT